jgi:hypothetical protein
LASIDIPGVIAGYFGPPSEQQIELANLQIAHPKLTEAWQKARESSGGFVIQNGVLFKQKPRHLRSDRELLLVYCQIIIRKRCLK